jgi:hypothetical protein
MADFFSGSKPDLISMKSVNDLVDIVFDGGAVENIQNVQNVQNIQNAFTTLTKPISFDIKNIYTEYIKPNILAIIIILLFAFFIFFRYFSLKDEKFNPAQPIDSQPNRNNYVSGVDVNIPVLYDLEEINKLTDDEILNKMKKKSKQFEKSPTINKCDGRPGEEREEVIYGSTAWANQNNGELNPMYGNDYVKTTAMAVEFNNERNKDSLHSATKMIFE